MTDYDRWVTTEPEPRVSWIELDADDEGTICTLCHKVFARCERVLMDEDENVYCGEHNDEL
jgi:hypothetical protein